MNKMTFLLCQVYTWIVFVPFLCLTTLIVGLACIGLCLVTPPGPVGRWGGKIWGKFNGYAALMPVTVAGKENLDNTSSYVVVANHQSQVDIFAVYGWLGIDFRWVMKKELRKVPVLGVCCEKLGHIIVDRSDTQAAVAAINAAREKISNGTSVFFFPEGTRSRDGKLHSFKKGAFKLAIDLQLPILPVTITGTHKILPPDTMSLTPGRAELIIHQPIETTGYDITRLEELMARSRAAILSSL